MTLLERKVEVSETWEKNCCISQFCYGTNAARAHKKFVLFVVNGWFCRYRSGNFLATEELPTAKADIVKKIKPPCTIEEF